MAGLLSMVCQGTKAALAVLATMLRMQIPLIPASLMGRQARGCLRPTAEVAAPEGKAGRARRAVKALRAAQAATEPTARVVRAAPVMAATGSTEEWAVVAAKQGQAAREVAAATLAISLCLTPFQ